MRRAWVLTFLLLGAACGGEERGEPDAGPAVPPTPEAALAWVREASDDEPELRKRLEAWPMDAEAFADSEETHIVLTWRLRLALQDGDVETALRRQHALQDLFDGEGLSPEGRVLSADVVRGAIFDEALYRARVRSEGAKPDAGGATRALDIASEMAPEGDGEAAQKIARTLRWIGAGEVESLIGSVASTGAPAPRILVYADDFALGEGVFISVLERWQRDGRDAGVGVEIVPVRTGQIRMGIRRVPAESREAELASIRARVKQAGITVVHEPIEAAELEAIGLGPQATALLVVNADGRIIARESGKNLDPRVLDPVIERLLSR